MHNPLVSIIIPVYNAELYVTQTIKSALNQTWANKEIIIIDDGSTDNSLQLCKQFENDNIKIISQNNNGASNARNAGLKIAKGEYVQFLDSDDLLDKHKIHNQILELINKPNFIAVCPTVHFFTKKDLHFAKPSEYESQFLYSTDNPLGFLLNLYGENGTGSMIQPNAWLVPISLIHKAGPWNEELTLDDDGEYFCRVLLASSGVVFVDTCFNYYRKYKDNRNLASQSCKKSFESSFKAIVLKKESLIKNGADNNQVKVLDRSSIDLAIMCYPEYKLLSKKIISQTNPKAFSYMPIIGGTFIQIILNVFGWKTARILQYYKKQFFKSYT